MRIEVIYALGPGSGGTATMIAITMADIDAVANFLSRRPRARRFG